ncbi:putative Ribonuclease [Hypsibius exemplaris]|uniref:Ribonuclease n=1 Tax=Hypsibius exemplaris TaxID=2072580 RepID=A0A1W0W8L7_HYPEX|nr:putative Ribonuclease [Hypsibius exemplaris]
MSDRSVLRTVITSPKSPAAIGPYSPAILANETLYISGQLGIDSSKGELVPGGVEKEAEQALINLGSILHAANADYNNVVKTTVLLADINDFVAVNQVYGRFFTRDPPARAAYQVAALPKAARVEIEAIAIIGNIRTE